MVDFESFLKWCEEKFQDVVVKDDEIRINSIFTEDTKFHMWCSPSGGKWHREDGCYRCFKTDKRGTLIGLVMDVENCTYNEAKDILSGNIPIGVLEDQINEFFANKEIEEVKVDENKLKLPEETYLIDSLPETSSAKVKARSYLKNRKIPTKGFYICLDGEYRDRIIIPYYDAVGTLIYFNGRRMDDRLPKYLGPKKEIGVGKGDVLYAHYWPPSGSKIYLTEGELDALTLNFCGFYGMACGGKSLSDKQIELLRKYKVCLALDKDNAGFEALLELANRLIMNQIEVTFVRPPEGIKDWNKMYCMYKAEIVSAWIERNEAPFDDFTKETLLLEN